MSETADIIIIGTGTFGASVAYYLSKYKSGKTVVIEKNTLASGATSWAASLINRVRTKEEQIPLVMETYKTIDEIENEFDLSVGSNKVGCLHIAASEESGKTLNEIIRLSEKYSVKGERINPKGIKDMLPWIDPTMLQEGYFSSDDMYVDGYLLAMAYARAARRNGVIFKQKEKILEILTEGNRVTGILTARGDKIEAPVVVNAGGSWSNLLSFPLGIALPMAPVRSIYWHTVRNSHLFPQKMPMVFIPDAMVYTRPESGALLFGIRDLESKSFDPRELPEHYNGFSFIGEEEHWAIIEKEGEEFRRFFPRFYDTPVERMISGVSSYTSDGKFIIGPSGKLKGFYVATGCNGAGVAVSGGVGRLMAEMISGSRPMMNPDPFSPDRYGHFDPYSIKFRKKCSAMRAGKRYGG